jgi:hypothetical protein
MALSTRTKLAGLGVAIAAGVLGATGFAYANDNAGGTSYVTTVDDESTAPSQSAPGNGGQRDPNCPEKDGSGGQGGGGSESSPAPSPSTLSTPPAVDEGDL